MRVQKLSEKRDFFEVMLRSDSSIMNFRDMGPFEKLSYAHVNIGFYLSDPPFRVSKNKPVVFRNNIFSV